MYYRGSYLEEIVLFMPNAFSLFSIAERAFAKSHPNLPLVPRTSLTFWSIYG